MYIDRYYFITEFSSPAMGCNTTISSTCTDLMVGDRACDLHVTCGNPHRVACDDCLQTTLILGYGQVSSNIEPLDLSVEMDNTDVSINSTAHTRVDIKMNV